MYKQNKTQLATKLYNQGIKRFFEEVKQSDWNQMFDSEFIQILCDPNKLEEIDIGPFVFTRKGNSTIEAHYELSRFGNTVFFTFENKINEFREVSDFINLCYEKLEEYSLKKVSNLSVEQLTGTKKQGFSKDDYAVCMVDKIKALQDGDDKSLTEEEMDQIVSEVEKRWESPKNSFEIDTFIPHEEEPETKTEDSAETEIVDSTKTMTEEETSEAVQDYQNRTGFNKRGRKSKRS